jgi:hypothetical protein
VAEEPPRGVGNGVGGEGARWGWGGRERGEGERGAAPMGKTEKLHGQQWGGL